jgi:hypothetical protein
MRTKHPRNIFGVEVIYVPAHRARKVVSVITGYRSTWMLLPDGRVGTNDVNFFKWAFVEKSRSGVDVAEKLWRLGKLPKSAYLKLSKEVDRKEAARDATRAACEFEESAKRLGIALTKAQIAMLPKRAA